MLDVNLNRLTESLKFLEDYVRFEVIDQVALEKIRCLRRDFYQLKKSLPFSDLIAQRRSEVDPGRKSSFDSASRNDDNDLVIANFTRAKEASRTIEEIMRMRKRKLSKVIKRIRFQIYDLEKMLVGKIKKKFDPRLYAIIDEKYLNSNRLGNMIGILEDYGATMIQLRIKRMSDREFYCLAVKARRLIRGSVPKFIINDRADIALAVGADGFHLGQKDMPVGVAREIFGSKFIIGVSARSIKQALGAQRSGADYLGVGAVFRTQTKNDARVCGLDLIRRISRCTNVPIVAIGGINDKNYRQVLKAGASGIAVASYLFEGNLEKNIQKLVF